MTKLKGDLVEERDRLAVLNEEQATAFQARVDAMDKEKEDIGQQLENIRISYRALERDFNTVKARLESENDALRKQVSELKSAPVPVRSAIAKNLKVINSEQEHGCYDGIQYNAQPVICSAAVARRRLEKRSPTAAGPRRRLPSLRRRKEFQEKVVEFYGTVKDDIFSVNAFCLLPREGLKSDGRGGV